jgi:lipoprotein-releasing system ATP-binding protein
MRFAMNDAVAPPPIEALSLHKEFTGGDGSRLQILRGVDFEVQSREVVAVIGSSGAGKSTLLHLLGALDRPSSGTVRIGGEDVALVDDGALADLRNRRIGFVFQFHHLLREFSALENVMTPCLVAGRKRAEAEAVARELLTAVGLQHRLDHRARQLSGGEQQRVAVARALANDPVVLLADEPSGNLDTKTSLELHHLLFELREARGLAMVLVTHNLELAGRADRVLELKDGVLNGNGAEAG